MSSIVVYTSPARGHLFPVLGVALELKALGHTVHVRTLATEVERVRSLGLSAEAIDEAIEARELDDWRAKNPIQALSLAMSTFADHAKFEVDDLRNAITEAAADALVIDTNSWGAQAAAEASGLPWAVFQPYFTPLPAPGVPPFGPGFAPASNLGTRARDRIIGGLVARKMAKVALPGINAQRRRLELEPFETMAEFQLAPPRVIYFTVQAFEHPRAWWPESYRFVGPGTWSPQEGQLDWLESVDRPIALVTCSSERQNDQVILESALRGLPADGLFVVGTSAAFSPDEVGSSGAPHTRVERFVPHDAVLARASVAISHGGMGITQRAVSHGVPLVVVPFGRDQLEVGRRVENAGAGVMVSPKKLTPAKLAASVRQARGLDQPLSVWLMSSPRRAGIEPPPELSRNCSASGPGATDDVIGISTYSPRPEKDDRMTNILTIVPEKARGIRRLFYAWVRRQYGGVVPGVFQVLSVDLKVARPAGALYKHLHLRKTSPLSRLQREMLATVVNGKVGGAP